MVRPAPTMRGDHLPQLLRVAQAANIGTKTTSTWRASSTAWRSAGEGGVGMIHHDDVEALAQQIQQPAGRRPGSAPGRRRTDSSAAITRSRSPTGNGDALEQQPIDAIRVLQRQAEAGDRADAQHHRGMAAPQMQVQQGDMAMGLLGRAAAPG